MPMPQPESDFQKTYCPKFPSLPCMETCDLILHMAMHQRQPEVAALYKQHGEENQRIRAHNIRIVHQLTAGVLPSTQSLTADDSQLRSLEKQIDLAASVYQQKFNQESTTAPEEFIDMDLQCRRLNPPAMLEQASDI